MMSGTRSALLLAALLAAASAVGAASSAAPSAVAHPSRWPAAHSPSAITDAATEKRITDLIARMTVEQKVGQLVQADISTITPERPCRLSRSDRSSREAIAGPTATNARRRRMASRRRQLPGGVVEAGGQRHRDPDPVRGGCGARPQQPAQRDDISPQYRARRRARSRPHPAHRRGDRGRGQRVRDRMDLRADHRRAAGPALGPELTRAIRPIPSWSRPMPAR